MVSLIGWLNLNVQPVTFEYLLPDGETTNVLLVDIDVCSFKKDA